MKLTGTFELERRDSGEVTLRLRQEEAQGLYVISVAKFQPGDLWGQALFDACKEGMQDLRGKLTASAVSEEQQ